MPEQLRFNRENIIFAIVSVAIIGAIAGCTSSKDSYESLPLPDRNTPGQSEYSLDTSAGYYAHVAATRNETNNPETLAHLDALLQQPVAKWLTDDSLSLLEGVKSIASDSEQEGTIPLFVTYNIPNRDLGSYSSGGATDGTEYQAWTGQVSQAIGDRPSVIVVEPDALAQLPDMDTPERQARISQLADALDTYHANEQSAVYLDAGNARWLPAEEAADLIQAVEDQTEHDITGVSLNVSNYISAQETEAYAENIQRAYGKKLFVLIDNSRNGNPSAIAPEDWCNPAGQRLGNADHIFSPSAPVEEAYIKTPGESDGECGISDLPAGKFDVALLLHQLGE